MEVFVSLPICQCGKLMIFIFYFIYLFILGQCTLINMSALSINVNIPELARQLIASAVRMQVRTINIKQDTVLKITLMTHTDMRHSDSQIPNLPVSAYLVSFQPVFQSGCKDNEKHQQYFCMSSWPLTTCCVGLSR